MTRVVAWHLPAAAAGPPQGGRLTHIGCKRRNAVVTSSTDAADAFCIRLKFPVAMLVFLAAAARAHVVASDLLAYPRERRGGRHGDVAMVGGRCERFVVARVLVL